ncbi:MAG: hypothetical protein H0V49_02050 [Nocardioidaceae bacterium]|nr:hypothetical protein [Nocardioidaceae bacterium]
MYVVLAWAVVVGLVAQVFLIGLALLAADASGISLHRNIGWIVHLLPIAVLVFAWFSRASRGHWMWALASAVVVFLVPIFVLMRDSVPVLAALHPVAALLAFPLSLVVALNSLRALRGASPVNIRSVTG